MMNDESIDDGNFILYAAKHYDNPQCYDTEEFYEDLKRFKYIKRLFGRYQEGGDLKERLVLNHIIIIYNVFGSGATKMLFYKLEEFLPYLKPFLVLLGRMPEKVTLNKVFQNSDIPMDNYIIELLRKI